MHGKFGMTIDDPLRHGASNAARMRDPYCLSNPKAFQPGPFTHQRKVVHRKRKKTIHAFKKLTVLQRGDYFSCAFHGTFPFFGREWHLTRHYFSKFVWKYIISLHRKWAVSRPSNCKTLSALFEIKI